MDYPTSANLPTFRHELTIGVPSNEEAFNEKATPLSNLSKESRRMSPSTLPSSSSRLSPSSPAPTIAPSAVRSRLRTQTYTRPRGLRIANLIRPWIPIILYAATSLGFLVAITLYKSEVFARLDELSTWLKADENYGYAVLFFLIFLTTIPPFPLYSTLIVLSGYTFGPWTGAVLSYFSALSGAVLVFVVSRTLLHTSISCWLDSACTMKRVIRAVEKRPKLLFLIRLAPYPYNVMNCLLAAAPTLTFKTYTVCTALSLFKVIVHTSLGASIHSFRDYHVDEKKAKSGGEEEESQEATVARMWTIIGVILCLAILVYLSLVARKAVDEELENDEETSSSPTRDREERIAFLSGEEDVDLEAAHEDDVRGRTMAESPFRSHLPLSASRSPDGRRR